MSDCANPPFQLFEFHNTVPLASVWVHANLLKQLHVFQLQLQFFRLRNIDSGGLLYFRHKQKRCCNPWLIDLTGRKRHPPAASSIYRSLFSFYRNLCYLQFLYFPLNCLTCHSPCQLPSDVSPKLYS